jgi:hypothetical protein
MVKIPNFKTGTSTKVNAAVTNLNFLGILMSHCKREKNMENIPLNWLINAMKAYGGVEV